MHGIDDAELLRTVTIGMYRIQLLLRLPQEPEIDGKFHCVEFAKSRIYP
jgi:hypothetical protein